MDESRRELAAIVFTDIVGFTALSALDEVKALHLILLQRKLLQPIVEEFDGRWLKEIGDGLLLSFSSSIKAVRCAIQIQHTVLKHDDLNLRIGIHQGDILLKDGDIFGDDVNIASRIEPFAAAGGIAISNKVNDDISGSPEITTKLISKSKLKGVTQGITIYCLTSHGLPKSKLSKVRAKLEPKPIWVRLATFLVPTLVLLSLYQLFYEPQVPSVGILYMENLGSEEDEFWARGITEDLIIEIASAGLIRVAPMQEIAKFIESSTPLLDIAKKLRVKYLLTSNIHKRDGVLELRAQLIEAKTGNSVYAEKWSDSLDQASSITALLAENILEELSVDPKREISNQPPVNPEAYELYLRGKHQWAKRENEQDIEIALSLLSKAAELEPNLLYARLQLGICYWEYGDNPKALKILSACLNQSKKLDQKLVETSALLNIGNVLLVSGEYEQALENYTQALKIAQALGDRYHETSIQMNIGSLHYYQGNLEIALSYYENSLSTSKKLKNLQGEGDAYFNIGSVRQELLDLTAAREAYNASYDIFHELDEKSQELYPLLGQGMIENEMGNLESALRLFEDALRIARDIHDLNSEINALLSIADIYSHLGQLDKALEYGQQGLEKSNAIQDTYNGYFAHQLLGEVRLETGEYGVAISHFRNACEVWNEADDSSYYLMSLSFCALAKMYAEKLDSARMAMDQLEAQMINSDLSPDSEIVVYWNQYQVSVGLGDAGKAESQLEAAYRSVSNLSQLFNDPDDGRSYIANNQTCQLIVDAYERSSMR